MLDQANSLRITSEDRKFFSLQNDVSFSHFGPFFDPENWIARKCPQGQKVRTVKGQLGDNPTSNLRMESDVIHHGESNRAIFIRIRLFSKKISTSPDDKICFHSRWPHENVVLSNLRADLSTKLRGKSNASIPVKIRLSDNEIHSKQVQRPKI